MLNNEPDGKKVKLSNVQTPAIKEFFLLEMRLLYNLLRVGTLVHLLIVLKKTIQLI